MSFEKLLLQLMVYRFTKIILLERLDFKIVICFLGTFSGLEVKCFLGKFSGLEMEGSKTIIIDWLRFFDLFGYVLNLIHLINLT